MTAGHARRHRLPTAGLTSRPARSPAPSSPRPSPSAGRRAWRHTPVNPWPRRLPADPRSPSPARHRDHLRRPRRDVRVPCGAGCPSPARYAARDARAPVPQARACTSYRHRAPLRRVERNSGIALRFARRRRIRRADRAATENRSAAPMTCGRAADPSCSSPTPGSSMGIGSSASACRFR